MCPTIEVAAFSLALFLFQNKSTQRKDREQLRLPLIEGKESLV